MGTQNNLFKLMDKKIIATLRKLFLLNWPYKFVPKFCVLAYMLNIDEDEDMDRKYY